MRVTALYASTKINNIARNVFAWPSERVHAHVWLI